MVVCLWEDLLTKSLEPDDSKISKRPRIEGVGVGIVLSISTMLGKTFASLDDSKIMLTVVATSDEPSTSH